MKIIVQATVLTLVLTGCGVADDHPAPLELTDDAAPQGHPPVVGNDFFVTTQDQPLVASLYFNDYDMDPENLADSYDGSGGWIQELPESAIALNQPAHGTAELVGPERLLRYTPSPGYIGADSFAYAITDYQGLTTAATVAIDVRAPADMWLVHDVEVSCPVIPCAMTLGDANGQAARYEIHSFGPADYLHVANADGSFGEAGARVGEIGAPLIVWWQPSLVVGARATSTRFNLSDGTYAGELHRLRFIYTGDD